MSDKKHGYTLIEVLIAAAIVALLTALGIVSYSSINKRSRDAKRKGDIEQLRSSLEMYRSDQGYYPAENITGFNTTNNLATDLTGSAGYIASIPVDPQSPNQIYYFKAENLDTASGHYFGYCLCGFLETMPASSTSSNCVETLPGNCNYGLSNP